MKKLLTLLFTLCITFIGYNAAFAVCNNNSMGAEDFDVYPTFNLQYRDLNNNVAGTGAVNGQSVTVNNLRSYEFLDIIFSLNLVNHYVTFNGAFTITNQTPNSFSTEAFLQTISAPHILFTTEVHPDGIRDGACHFTSLNLNDTSQFVVDAQTGGDRFYYQSISWSVECYVGDDTDHTHFRGLRFDYLQNFINPNTSINGNVFFAAYIVPQYQHYNNPYDYQLCQILEGIDNQSSTDATTITNQLVQSTQDLITNDNTNTQSIINNQNNNTQQIVDELTDTNCVPCDNKAIFQDSNSSFNGISVSVLDNTFTFSGNFTGSGFFPLYSGTSVSIPAGTYRIEINKALPGNFLPFWNQDNCMISAGQTSTTCTLGSNRNVGMRMSFTNGATYNINSLQIYIGTGDYCIAGEQVCTGSNKLDNINDTLQQTQDYLSADPSTAVSGAVSNINRTLQDIAQEDSNYYLLDFIRLPLILIRNINNGNVCQPIVLQVPYLTNKTLTIPCMRPIIENYFGSMLSLYHTVVTFFMSYYIFGNVYRKLKQVSDLNSNDAEKSI